MKNRIKEVRKAKGITQKELAEMLGITPQAVSQFEKSDSKRFTMATLQNIARALDCSVESLFAADNELSIGYQLEAEKSSERSGSVKRMTIELSELNRMGQDALEDYLSLLLDSPKYTVHDIDYLLEIWGDATVKRFYPDVNYSEDNENE